MAKLNYYNCAAHMEELDRWMSQRREVIAARLDVNVENVRRARARYRERATGRETGGTWHMYSGGVGHGAQPRSVKIDGPPQPVYRTPDKQFD